MVVSRFAAGAMYLVERLPDLLAQDARLPQMFKNREIDSTLLIQFLLFIGCAAVVITVGLFFYNRWKKYKEFENEMKSLELEPDAEETLATMVKRYSINEPVNVLFSSRLFDEMASNEIKRILASPASAEFKEEYINRLYQIRMKTYHPDLLHSNPKGYKPRYAPKNRL